MPAADRIRHRFSDLSLTCTFVLVACASPAQALQTIDARDGVAVEAIVSIKEPTRIRIDGAPIIDVVGNVQAGNCGTPGAAGSVGAAMSSPAAASSAEVMLECDRDKGEIYVRPIGASTKPINLFIASSAATYTLLLRRSDTPADTIVIRDKSARSPSPVGNGLPGSSASHIRGMKSMLVSMAQDLPPVDFRMDVINQPAMLWNEARFTLLRRYEGRGLVGEKYLLQNITSTEMVVAEPEFDLPDSVSGGRVIGIAVEIRSLRPLETTHVFVIRRGGDR